MEDDVGMRNDIGRLLAVLAALSLAVAVGCSSDPESVTSSATADTSPPSTEVSTTVVSTEGASCGVGSILPVVADLFPENDVWVITGIDISECQNGYARVFTIPDQSECPGENHCRESEQVFLQLIDDQWEYLDSGTGLDCNSSEQLISEACEALDLP